MSDFGSGLGVLLFLVFISAIPVIAAFCWFRISRYPFPLTRFLIVLLAGAAAFFPALILQKVFSLPFGSGKWGLFAEIFIRIAFTEELSRLLVLLVLFWLSRRIAAGTPPDAAGRAQSAGTLSYSEVSKGTAAGLVAGLGFAFLESAVYGASDAGIALLRIFTAAPLHAACGSRVGAAAVMVRERPAQAVFRFLSAVAIHGIYNFLVVSPGFPSIAAVLIALSALASSILAIRGQATSPH
jgi:RsiW-degrading membrane proteinase PrsW (M82 family)